MGFLAVEGVVFAFCLNVGCEVCDLACPCAFFVVFCGCWAFTFEVLYEVVDCYIFAWRLWGVGLSACRAFVVLEFGEALGAYGVAT